MPRTQRNLDNQVQAIGLRFIELLTTDFGMTLSEAARTLGYANAATLYSIKNGRAVPDPVRLAQFVTDSSVTRADRLNLHWIFTGKGARFLPRKTDRMSNEGALDNDIIDRLRHLSDPEKRALLVLIGPTTRR